MTNLPSPSNSDSSPEWMAAYALDILEEQAEFELEATSDQLQSELAAWQLAVQELAYGVPVAPLPVDLKKKLFDRLADMTSRPVRKFAAHTVTGVESNLKFTHSSQI